MRWSEPSPVMVDVWFNTMLARSAVTVFLPISLTVKSETDLFSMPVPSVVFLSIVALSRVRVLVSGSKYALPVTP